MSVNWCTSCLCVLANEEVVDGVCERCGSQVVHRDKEQWMLKITAYADKLLVLGPCNRLFRIRRHAYCIRLWKKARKENSIYVVLI